MNGVVGQTIVLQASGDLLSWQPLATNTLAANRWVYSDSQTGSGRYYRAWLQ